MLSELDFENGGPAVTPIKKASTVLACTSSEKTCKLEVDKDENPMMVAFGKAASRLSKFKLGSCLTSLEKENLPPEALGIADACWVSVTETGLLCSACKRAGLETPWAKGTVGQEAKDFSVTLKSHCMKRHEESSQHISAVRKMLQIDEASGAPPAEDFKALLGSLQAGKPLSERQSSSWSDKKALMTWVLNESLLEMERKEMILAATISLARDARRARLLIKFGFCTTTFGARAGVLGLKVGGGDKGGDVVRSTRRLIRRFCTKFSNRPRWYGGPEPVFLEDLYNHICSTVEIVMADSAANEVLAGSFTIAKFSFILSYLHRLKHDYIVAMSKKNFRGI